MGKRVGQPVLPMVTTPPSENVGHVNMPPASSIMSSTGPNHSPYSLDLDALSATIGRIVQQPLSQSQSSHPVSTKPSATYTPMSANTMGQSELPLVDQSFSSMGQSVVPTSPVLQSTNISAPSTTQDGHVTIPEGHLINNYTNVSAQK